MSSPLTFLVLCGFKDPPNDAVASAIVGDIIAVKGDQYKDSLVERKVFFQEQNSCLYCVYACA